MPDIVFNRTTTITFPNNPSITIGGIANGSLSLREVLCSDRLAFGDINANMFQCELYNTVDLTGKKIQVSQIDNGTTKVLFTGWVDSCKMDDLSGFRTLVAYDYFYKARKKKIKAWWKSYWAGRDQSTLGAMWKNLLTYYNIPYTNTDLICDSLVVKKKEMKKIKTSYLSTFLTKLCEINLCVPNISRSGVLEFIQFTDVTMVAGDAIDIRGDYTISKSKFEDYAIAPYDKIELYDKNNELCAEAGSGTNILVIQNNEFLFNQSETWLNEIANLMLSRMVEFSYIPANITMKVSDLDIHIGNLVRTQKGLCLVCENNYSGSLLVNQGIISNNQSEYDEPNAGTKLGDTPTRDAERIDFNIDEKSSIISGPELPTAGYGKDGDMHIVTTPPIKIERHINSSPYWYATQLKQNSNGKYDITVTGYSDPNVQNSGLNAAIFKAIGFGGAGTYHINCKMHFTGYIGNPWNTNIMGLYISYDDSGIYYNQDFNYGSLVTTPIDTFLLNMYYDTDSHEYSFDFTIDETHASSIVDKTMYITVVMERCWKYDEPMASGTLNVTDLEITGVNIDSDKDIIGIEANIDGTWKNVDYVNKVEQTQGETGGTEIAEINNTNGTKTKIYQKTVEANPTGEPSEVLAKLTIGETLYELGGGQVDDVMVDGDSVVTDKIANINTMTGATANEAGTKGLVPAPASGDNEKFLRGDGTWQTVQSGGGVVGDGVYSEHALWEYASGSSGTVTLSQPLSDFDAIYLIMASGTESNYRSSQIIPVSAIDKTGATNFGVFDVGANNYYYSVLNYIDDTHISLGVWGSSYPVKYYKVVGIRYGNQAPVIYSEEEREIGVWTDGKPLYQKTIYPTSNVNTSNNAWSTVSWNDEPTNIEHLVAAEFVGNASTETIIPNNQGVFRFCINSGHIKVASLNTYVLSTNDRITFFYTKTTDIAGSGHYAALGVPAVHYSENEQVIGTWIDGSTLYQKTINFGGLPNNTTKIVAHGINNLGRIVKLLGTAYSTENGYTLPLEDTDGAIGITGVIRLFANNTNVYIVTYRDQTPYDSAYITIQYTKTSS